MKSTIKKVERTYECGGDFYEVKTRTGTHYYTSKKQAEECAYLFDNFAGESILEIKHLNEL